MLKNVKIGVRMGGGFALVVVLLVGTLAFAAMRMGSLNGRIQNIVEDSFPKTVLANQIIDGVNGNVLQMRELLATSDADKAKSINDQMASGSKEVSEHYDKLSAMISNDDEKLMLDSATEARKQFAEVRDRITAAYNGGKKPRRKKLPKRKLPPCKMLISPRYAN